MTISTDMKLNSADSDVIVINIGDKLYPQDLMKLKLPPEKLYAKGNLELLNGGFHTAITGTEKVSMKGMDVAIGLSNILSGRGHTIVGGLERGCSTGGHLGCLGTGGKSIAVLSSPVTDVMPEENQHIADKILQNSGLLISAVGDSKDEWAGESNVQGELIAALCDGMIVIESFCDEQLLMGTVKTAVNMNKTVGAYRHPGGFDMTDTSEGNEYLIKECGAIPVRNIKDTDKFVDIVEKMRRNNK